MSALGFLAFLQAQSLVALFVIPAAIALAWVFAPLFADRWEG